MTMDEVLQAVGLFGPWNIDCDGYIRNQDGCCPLGALLVARGYRQHKLPTAFDAARLLSLDCAYDLIWAADVPGTRLRSRLLVACGLRGAES